MIKELFLIGFILVSCSHSDKQENKEKMKSQKTVPTLEMDNKDRELYFEFILNLEKTLWSSDLFVKTDYEERGWQLLDKHGKYIMRSGDNFTKYRDTSVNYAITIIKIDNYLTNKDGVDTKISIPYKLPDGRTKNIDLDFTYDNKSKMTDEMMYSEVTHQFPFNYGIIVDYRGCFNSETSLVWKNGRIIQYEFDCNEEDGYIQKTLW